ncbi:MAG: cytochrome b [Methylococcaceae bacterium]
MVGHCDGGWRRSRFGDQKVVPPLAMSNTTSHYTHTAQVFHWLIAVLVLAAFVMGPGGSETSVYSQAREFERQVHSLLGMLVFGLSVLRLLWRLGHRRPTSAPMPAWMLRAATWGHRALYVLLFAVPLTAISGAWLEGHSVGLLLGLEFAPQLALDRGWGAWVSELHTWLGDAMLWLAGLHAAAAIYHHYVRKDGTLLSMMPCHS